MHRLAPRRVLLPTWLLWSTLCAVCGVAQVPSGTISGAVTDPSGAVVPNATVSSVAGDGTTHAATSDDQGRYAIRELTPGSYTVTAAADGFAAFQRAGVRVEGDRATRLNIRLAIAVQQQQVTVSDQGTAVDVSPEHNASALVLQPSDLDVLSEDPSALQAELQTLAGPTSGGDTGQVYVDGFTANGLPPKSAIREVRINQNPYSAQFDRVGRGRIEVFTKPGNDNFHGGFQAVGNDSSFNSTNPFAQDKPPYHSVQFDWNLSGPIIKKKAAFFANAYRGNAESYTVVDAETLDATLRQTHFSQAVSNPSSSTGFGSRFDLQGHANNTLTVRYDFYQARSFNSGVGQFALAPQGYYTNNSEQSLQLSDLQIYGSEIVNQTRLQMVQERNSEIPQNSNPTITVLGAFTGGGSNLGRVRDKQDRYELQDYASIDVGRHFLKFGGRLRALRESDTSTANFNGNFIFSSLSAYQATERGIEEGLAAARIRAGGGGASQFNVNAGDPAVSLFVADIGLYLEDDWRLRPNLVVSAGLRLETQNHISDHANLGPRFGIAWAVGNRLKGEPKTVLRAGYGWFYTRFAANYLLQAERQNGINQKEFVAISPEFYPNIPPLGTLEAETASTIYRMNPALRVPYVMQAGISVDRELTKSASFSVSYLNSRGVHQLFSRNINAPLPGTYDPAAPGSGIRPFGGNENIYQYVSEGIYKQKQLIVNLSARGGSMLTIFGYYALTSAYGNTSGAGSFPSNQYDISVDYGRTAYDIRHRVSIGGSLLLPRGLRASPFVVASSGVPFNIVVGQDLNGDAQFNDRPAFATDPTRPSVVRTQWGIFDTTPIPGQKIIPINYGVGPVQFTVNLRVGKSFNFGPRTGNRSSSASNPEKRASDRCYVLAFDISAQNIFNRVNLAPPIGTLGSPFFGKYNSLATSATANRVVTLDMHLRF